MSQSKKKKEKQKPAPNQWIWIAALLVVGFLAFSPVIQAEFINYDDELYITGNPLITQPNGENLKTLYTSFYGNQYSPVAMTIMALEWKVFGGEPGALKFISILLHLANALLVFFFVRKLLKRPDIAIIVSGLFALHTLQVESVAWMAASMKIGTYSLFTLASLLAYLSYLEKKQWSRLVLSLVFFVLSCMCKEQAVVLPILLLAVDYLQKRNLLSGRVWLEKLPFIAVSLAFGLATMTVADEMRGSGEALSYPLADRIVFATYALSSYVLKHVLPVGLSTYYTYPVPGAIPWYYYASPLLCLAILGGFIYAWKKDQRLVVFGLLFFLANIILTLLSQVFSVREVLMADRYVYLSAIGFFLIPAYWLTGIAKRTTTGRILVFGGFAVYVLVLAGLTFQRSGVWKNTVTVFTDAIEKGKPEEGKPWSPSLALPFSNRGMAKKAQGDIEGALADYEKAIACNPGYAKAYLNRGNIFLNTDMDRAIENYNKSLELDPNNEKTYSSRGAAYARKGIHDKAMVDFNKAIEMDPNYRDALNNRALLHFYQRNYEKALADLDQALKTHPGEADLINFKGQALQKLRRYPEAEAAMNEAIRLAPTKGAYYYTRSLLYWEMADKTRANQDAVQARSLGYDVPPEYLNQLQ